MFPCKPDKKPHVEWRNQSTTDSEAIRRWWRTWPDALPAIDCAKSGIVVVDLDLPKTQGAPNGLKSFGALLEEDRVPWGVGSDSVAVATLHGGLHLFHRQPDPHNPLGNSPGRLAGRGIDIRGAGGYVIAPGARRVDGSGYRYVDNSRELPRPEDLPPLPEALVSRIRSKQAAPAVPAPQPAQFPAHVGSGGDASDERGLAYAERALELEASELSDAPKGGRNAALNKAAHKLGGYVHLGLSELRIADALMGAANANGLIADDGEDAARKTIKSGLEAGRQRPRSIPQDALTGVELTGQEEARERFLKSGRQMQAATPAAQPSRARIKAAPFPFLNPADIPRREWLYGGHYIRKYVTATIAPGGVGKTTLITVEALAMASGRNLLGPHPAYAARVWLHNGEDPMDEMQRRVTAAMLHHKLVPDDVAGHLFVTSGRTTPITIAETRGNGTAIAAPNIEEIKVEIIANRIDVLIVDPFVSCHRVNENDNNAIQQVAAEWAKIAEETNCSIELVHHSRKANGNGTTVDDARGASALVSAARSVRTLNVMTKDEAEKAGVENPRSHVRIEDGKPNMTQAGEFTRWYRLESVQLHNGLMGTPGDKVGVATAWRMPNQSLELTEEAKQTIFQKICAGSWREDLRSADWVGFPIAETLGLDSNSPTHKAHIKAVITMMIKQGFLTVTTKLDANRKSRQYVEVAPPNLLVAPVRQFEK